MVALQVGDILEGRYRIDHPIARGGMSTVFRCVDVRLGRAVAVKVLDERYVADPAFRARFRREARAMARLSHPNLVGVYDFGAEGDYLYLVMELITGGTLRELLAERGPMPPHAATAVMRAVLTGLAVTHAAGLVHRDIKPDNVLISADHQVKLSDFGLVRASNTGEGVTEEIVGTVAYLSPEQVNGSDIKPASDVYAAGLLLYELLTGTTPFRGGTDLEQAYRRLNEEVPAPSSAIDGVPPLFDALVASATTRNTNQRFSDAAEFLTALNNVAVELRLPAFQVPVPHDSAAHRAAAVPTDFSDLLSPLAETGIIEAPTVAAQPTPTAVPAEPTQVMPATEPPAPAARLSQEYAPVAPPVSNRSGWKFTIWLTIVTMLIAAVAIGGWWLGSGRYGEIPQIIGLDRTAATQAIEQAGFSVETSDVYDDEVAVSLPAGTDPAAGRRLVRGEAVTLLLSLGQPTVPEIPPGADPQNYQELLSQRTLTARYGEQLYSDDVAAGQLISTDPPAGQTVSTGTAITLHISKGPAPVAVPDVRGMKQADAISALEGAGLRVSEVTERFAATTPAGEVIDLTPAAGSTATRGSTIALVVSNAIEVPDVVGMSLDEATTTLAAAGLTVSSTNRVSGQQGDSANEVIAVQPNGGKFVDPAAPQVTLSLPGKVKVPSVIGKRVGEAQQILHDAGLIAELSDEDTTNDDFVLTQSPRARQQASPGDTVRLRAF